MSHIIEALKRAREEGTKKSKGTKLSNILAPAGKSGKKFKLSKNTIILIASGFMFLFAISYTMKPYLEKRNARKNVRERIIKRQDSKNVLKSKLQKPEPQKKVQPEVKTLARQLPQTKEFVSEMPAPEHEKKELRKPEPQKKVQPEVKTLARQLPQTKEFISEMPAPEHEKKELQKPEPQKIVQPEVKALARQLPQTKEFVSEMPEHEKNISGHSSIKSKSPIYHFNLGTFYQGEKKLEKAKEEYEQVIFLEPFNVEAHNNLGMIYKDLRKFDKAIKEYKKAIALDPQYQKAYYNSAVAFYLKGDIKSATTEARLAIALNPNDLESYNILSISHKKMNNYSKAMEILQNALLVDSSHPQTHYNFALLLEEGGRIKAATFHYRKFIDFSKSEKNRELIEKVVKHLEQMPLQ